MNKHLKVGIATGLTFGLAMATYGYFSTGTLTSVLINALGGVLFGATMAFFNSRGERRLKARGIEATDLNPVQLRKLLYPGTPQEAMEAARLALSSLRKVKKVTEAATPPQLKAKTGITFESFGEVISVELTPTTEGTIVDVSSKPRISSTQMDMGKGVENVETVVNFLIGRGATRRAA